MPQGSLEHNGFDGTLSEFVSNPVVSTHPAAPPPPMAAIQLTAEDPLGALKSIAEVGSLFVALSFVGGWSFTVSYYLSFGVGPSDLDFSVPATSALAVHMLRRAGWPILLAGALFAGFIFSYGNLGSARRAWAGVCVAILLFTVATAGSLRGRTLATEDMFDTSPRLPNVGFVAKSVAQEPDCLAKGTTDCKLLLHTKGAYYFFEPIPSAARSSVHGQNIKIYIVPDSEVSSTQLVRGVE